MRKISKMYELSGGCDRHHKCAECGWFVNADKKGKSFSCGRHPEQPEGWDGSLTACKWFMGIEINKEDGENLDGQMTIFDLMKGGAGQYGNDTEGTDQCRTASDMSC